MFVVLKVNGTIEYKDIDNPDYNTLLNHLHPDSFGYEHPTDIENIWMLEDDAFEYVNEENRERNINKLGGKFITREAPIYGDCVLFRPGKNFSNGSFEDIEPFTNEDINKINSKSAIK